MTVIVLYLYIYIHPRNTLTYLSLLFGPLSLSSLAFGCISYPRRFECTDLSICEQEKMNRCGHQQSAMEMRGVSGSVVCPKPRRIGLFNPSVNNDQIRPSRLHINRQTEISDSKAGMELLDMILTKGSYGAEKSNNQVVSSPPPFFCGSPPSRASNPLSQDSQFGKDIFVPLAQAPVPATPPSANSSARTGGSCVRVKFGHAPAAVRIEGFDCLNQDRRSRSISAVA